MKQNFIKTQDAETAKLLRSLGYTQVGDSNGTFCFLNNGKQTFSEDVKKKIAFTNLICI